MTQITASARMAGRIGALLVALLTIAAPARAAAIVFGLTVTDFLAPTNFNFAFSEPLSPDLSGMVDVTANFDVTLTDGGSDGVTFTGKHPGGWAFAGFSDLPGGTSLGVDFGPICVVPPGGATSPGGGTTTCSFSGSNTVAWPALEQKLTAYIFFGLTGLGDMAVVTGTLTAVPHVDRVPEPVSLGLLSVACAAFELRRRRRPASGS